MDGRIYHIYNRGVEKKNIFLNDADRIRFIHDLYEFNDTAPAIDFYRSIGEKDVRKREKLVKIAAFCLMPNHHHLLCEEIEEKNRILFIKKLHGGYARAFNEKYKRNGYLFQGKYKKVLVETEKQFLQTICYIHANPLDLCNAKWREKKLTKEEIEEAVNFLENYKWSSHLDYLGKKNFSSVIDKEFSGNVFGEHERYDKVFKEWLSFFERDTETAERYLE